MKVTVIPRVIDALGTVTERLEIRRVSGNYPNYSTIKIGQNTQKSPVDLKKLAVTQISVKNHQLTLV